MNRNNLFTKVSFILGFMICLFPLLSNLIEGVKAKDLLKTYDLSINSISKEDKSVEINKAIKYNKILNNPNLALSNGNSTILSEDSYNSILNAGNGVIGSIEIPKIGVNLPIYHGTSDEVLSSGVGHLFGSSFPVGGESTRSILTGHRGLPSAKLFTRLDEVELGDLFFIKVFGKTLAYSVNDKIVIEPSELEKLGVVEGEDLVTLVTCTPYGVNTHRLIVTGKQVPFTETEYKSIKQKSMSFRELLFIGIPFIFLGILVVSKVIRNRKHSILKEDEDIEITF